MVVIHSLAAFHNMREKQGARFVVPPASLSIHLTKTTCRTSVKFVCFVHHALAEKAALALFQLAHDLCRTSLLQSPAAV